jgi:hypothetical protein
VQLPREPLALLQASGMLRLRGGQAPNRRCSAGEKVCGVQQLTPNTPKISLAGSLQTGELHIEYRGIRPGRGALVRSSKPAHTDSRWSAGCAARRLYGHQRAQSGRAGPARARSSSALSPTTRRLCSVHKSGPHSIRVPDRFHVSASLAFIYAEHIAPISIDERRNPVVRDAVDVDGNIAQTRHNRAELFEVLVGRILEVHGNVDVAHPKPIDARRLVWQRFFMRVERQVHDVADAESPDLAELGFGRLARCSYPIVEAAPVIDRFRIGQRTLRAA